MPNINQILRDNKWSKFGVLGSQTEVNFYTENSDATYLTIQKSAGASVAIDIKTWNQDAVLFNVNKQGHLVFIIHGLMPDMVFAVSSDNGSQEIKVNRNGNLVFNEQVSSPQNIKIIKVN